MLRIVQRSLAAAATAGIIALYFKLRGDTAQTPPEVGGWRELSGDDFR